MLKKHIGKIYKTVASLIIFSVNLGSYANASLISSTQINQDEGLDESACIANDIVNKSCPKILDISLAPIGLRNEYLDSDQNIAESLDVSLTQYLVAKSLKVTNKSKRNVTSIIAAEYNGVQVNCTTLSIPAKTSILATVSCNIPNLSTYTLYDVDGRSNKLKITAAPSGSCSGKAIGDECAGGKIFKLPTEAEYGLIAAVADNPTTAQWGCAGTTIGINAQSDTDGAANTSAIVNGCSDVGIAAKICSDYSVDSGGMTFNDWYLPAKDELNELYINKDAVGGFSGLNDVYLSSTEWSGFSSLALWVQNFTNGSQGIINKDSNAKFRCIQAFNN